MMKKILILFLILGIFVSTVKAMTDTELDACLDEALETVKTQINEMLKSSDVDAGSKALIINAHKEMEKGLTETRKYLKDPRMSKAVKEQLWATYQEACPKTRAGYNYKQPTVLSSQTSNISEVTINGINFKTSVINGVKVYFISNDTLSIKPFPIADECNIIRNACKNISYNYDMASPQQVENLWKSNKKEVLSFFSNNPSVLPSMLTIDKSADKLGQYTQIHESNVNVIGKTNFLTKAEISDYTCYKPYFDANKPASIVPSSNSVKNKYSAFCLPQ